MGNTTGAAATLGITPLLSGGETDADAVSGGNHFPPSFRSGGFQEKSGGAAGTCTAVGNTTGSAASLGITPLLSGGETDADAVSGGVTTFGGIPDKADDKNSQ